MLRSFFLSCVAIVGLTVGLSGLQDRPSFSGRWTLVADRSTPAGSKGVFGEAVTIAQQTTFIEIDVTVTGTQVTMQGGQTTSMPAASRTLTRGYEMDGVEHEMPPPEAKPGVSMMILSKTSYRAVWTTGQLVIVEHNRAAATRGNDVEGQITSVTRTAFSLDPDGLLIVDRIGIAMPRPNGPKQEPPVPTRSVYKKAQ